MSPAKDFEAGGTSAVAGPGGASQGAVEEPLDMGR